MWRYRLALAVVAVALGACAPRGPAPATTPPCVPVGRWVDPRTHAEVPAADVMARAARSRVVLLGEHHDRADHHRWQLQTLAAIQAAHPDVVVGFEMLPRRAQPALDRFAAGRTDERTFLVESRWADVWGFDPQLYLPLLHFARLNGLALRALNVDRTVVEQVGARGLDAVPPAAREGVGTPAPPAPAYEALLRDVWAAHGADDPHAAPGDNAARRRFVEAQLLWDRAMAEALADAVRADPHAIAVGILGSGHVERRFGVPHQLAALGIDDVLVLLPWDADRGCDALVPDVADVVFGVPAAPADVAPKPRLGVMLAAADGGARVAEVARHSVAAAAGLRVGDVITAAAGTSIDGPAALRAVVERQPPGTWLPLDVRRRGKRLHLVAKFPPADA